MKRIAYTALHYGAAYLAWALRSVQDVVDEIHILYSDQPSFGHSTASRCPESEEVLKQEAHRFATKPIIWHRGRWPSEGAHRDTIFDIAKERGASQILWVDADEIWDTATAKAALDEALGRRERIFGVHFLHFWRSFQWVSKDGAWPLRIYNVGGEPCPDDGYISGQTWPVFHFGYAQPEAIVRYKWEIHGHLGELRSGWLERFIHWKPGDQDVHPTCSDGYWNPFATDPKILETLRPLLSDHPYWNLDIIR